jgi:hypothetical protein
MKTSGKDIKKISVDGHEFFYVLHEKTDFVRLRIYSIKWKTAYCDLYFTWKDNWLIHFYKPSIAAVLIRHVMHNGWEYQNRGMMEIKEASFLIEELQLESLGEGRTFCEMV